MNNVKYPITALGLVLGLVLGIVLSLGLGLFFNGNFIEKGMLVFITSNLGFVIGYLVDTTNNQKQENSK
ncbi:hypothetical protein COL63_22320 [Bacillus pseudomycoides]|uniref:hypothetical protein n=1 Tax=Bacillus pseudomycoides TaxID=64104 RepID=UPI000BF727A5|nr:hypothetical protein [Bacillus pseudomycoides]PFZ09493.1 hypothetical protein COL63_22320 [Bacillus pseudomycoides]